MNDIVSKGKDDKRIEATIYSLDDKKAVMKKKGRKKKGMK